MTSRALVVCAGLAGSAGCAQIFGLDETSNTGRTNTVEVKRVSIGTTVTTVPQALTGLGATYFAPTGPAGAVTRVNATANELAGIWTVKLPDPAQVAFTLPAAAPDSPPQLHSYAFPHAALKVPVPVLEHPRPMPAPADAMITLTAPLDSAIVDGESFQVYTVGSWTQRGFPPENVPLGATAIGPVSYPFASSNNLSGRAELDALTTADAFLVLRYTGFVLSGVAEVPAFDQTGADVLAAPTMTRITPSETLDVTIDAATIATRYGTVRPAVTGLQMGWTMAAAPGYQLASSHGPVLAFGGLTMADLGVNLLYDNPFAARGWNTILVFNTVETRDYTPPDGDMGPMKPIELRAGMDQYIEPPAIRTALDLPAGLPRVIAINGSQLSADGQTISVPTEFAEVTFTTDNASGTLYSLQVSELVPSEADPTQLVRSQVLLAWSPEARFAVPPETFQLGKTYVLRAIATSGGYPNLASGDFVTRALPMAQAYLDSAVFTVTQ